MGWGTERQQQDWNYLPPPPPSPEGVYGPGEQPEYVVPWGGTSGAPARPHRLRWFLLGAVSMLVVGLGVSFALDDYSDEGVVAYGRGGELASFALDPGECALGEFAASEDHRVGRRVPCTAPHKLEAYHTAEAPQLDGDSYDQERLWWYADGVCLYAFAPYVGKEYWDSGLDYHSLVPSEAAWRDGAREIHCVAFDLDQGADPLRRSVRGSRL